MELYILGSNKEDVKSYKGLTYTEVLLGYSFLAFENGIGNISNPTVKQEWLDKDDATSTFLIGLVYFTWFLN